MQAKQILILSSHFSHDLSHLALINKWGQMLQLLDTSVGFGEQKAAR